MISSSIQIGVSHLEQLIDLRHAVLREGMSREAAVFAGDSIPTSRHYAAISDNRVIACATLHASTWADKPAWQLRGMAADPLFRGQGIGRRLLEFVEADIRANSEVHQLWCNARIPASGFYQRLGWAICSEPFEIPTAGPHYRMAKNLKSDHIKNAGPRLGKE